MSDAAGRLLLTLSVAALIATVPRGAPDDASVTPSPTSVEPIYRLRVTLGTTARVARLFLEAPSVMIEAREVSAGARASFGAFGRGPLRVSRRPGADSAAARFVAALAPGGAAELRFTSEREGRGRTVIRIENLNVLPGDALRRVSHRSPRRVFAVATSRAAARGPVAGTEPLPPEVFAFHYLWYEPSDWSGGKPIADYNRNPDPYSSADPAVFDRHVQQARDASIDGFLFSWQGAGSVADQNLQAMANRLPTGFKFAIYLEILNPGFGTPQELVSQMDYALDTYAGSDHYLRIQGRPVLYAFATRHLFMWPGGGLNPRYLEAWADVLDRLARKGHHPFLIGEGRHFPAENFTVFDGMHAYGTEDPLGTAAFNRRGALLARAWATVHGGPRRFYGASVIPGYDDRHILGRSPVWYFPHQDGVLYGAQWAAATDTASDHALVVSFNEWMETSNIEPNEVWGTRYLDLTAQYAGQFKQSRGAGQRSPP